MWLSPSWLEWLDLPASPQGNTTIIAHAKVVLAQHQPLTVACLYPPIGYGSKFARLELDPYGGVKKFELYRCHIHNFTQQMSCPFCGAHRICAWWSPGSHPKDHSSNFWEFFQGPLLLRWWKKMGGLLYVNSWNHSTEHSILKILRHEHWAPNTGLWRLDVNVKQELAVDWWMFFS